LAVTYHYIGLALGSFLIGFVSQWLKSRKKVLYYSLAFLVFIVGLFFIAEGKSTTYFYFLVAALGIGAGYWAVFITMASEQFGTNLRATVTTTVPNFVRGATVPITSSVLFLSHSIGLLNAGIVVGGVCFILAFIALFLLEETFNKDLDYLE
jgi:MFS family permease